MTRMTSVWPARITVCLALILVFTGCDLVNPPSTPTPTPTFTPTPPAPPVPCFFNWARQDLPELSTQVQAALDAAGLEGVTAYAYAFGEDCINPETDEVEYFATMETDFVVTIQVDDPSDLDALGDRVAGVLAVLLENFPTEDTPGPQPGQVELDFAGEDTGPPLYVMIEDATQAYDQGLAGAALLETLGYHSD